MNYRKTVFLIGSKNSDAVSGDGRDMWRGELMIGGLVCPRFGKRKENGNKEDLATDGATALTDSSKEFSAESGTQRNGGSSHKTELIGRIWKKSLCIGERRRCHELCVYRCFAFRVKSGLRKVRGRIAVRSPAAPKAPCVGGPSDHT